MIRALILATGCALATPALAQSDLRDDAAACAPGAVPGAALRTEVRGFKVRAGTIRVEVYPDNEADWLANKDKLEAEGKPFRRAILPVPTSGPLVVCVAMPAVGRYAVAVLHDPDRVRGFNFRSDGIGFPGDPRLGLSRPKVEKGFVTIGPGVTNIRVTLQYWNGFLGVGPVRRPAEGPSR